MSRLLDAYCDVLEEASKTSSRKDDLIAALQKYDPEITSQGITTVLELYVRINPEMRIEG